MLVAQASRRRTFRKPLRLNPPEWLTPPPLSLPLTSSMFFWGSCAGRPPGRRCCAAALLAVRVSDPREGPAAHKHREHIHTLCGEFEDTREQSWLRVGCGQRTRPFPGHREQRESSSAAIKDEARLRRQTGGRFIRLPFRYLMRQKEQRNGADSGGFLSGPTWVSRAL